MFLEHLTNPCARIHISINAGINEFTILGEISAQQAKTLENTRRDELRIILNNQSIDLLAINRNVFGTSLEIFGRLRKSSDIFGYYRFPRKNLDTLRIKMSRL